LDKAYGHALTTEWAVAWSFIIGSGASVREAGSDNVVHFKPATGAKLFFTSRFDRKHRHLQEIIPQCNPCWKVTKAEAADRTSIDTLADYKTFLWSQRTFVALAGVASSVPGHVVEPRTRYGLVRKSAAPTAVRWRGGALCSQQRSLNRSATVATELAASQL